MLGAASSKLQFIWIFSEITLFDKFSVVQQGDEVTVTQTDVFSRLNR